jgi:predicted nucleic acid-binding protein
VTSWASTSPAIGSPCTRRISSTWRCWNALRRLVSSGEATAERAGQAIADLLDRPIERYPHDILVPRIWQLRENFSVYDASYVALAEGLADEPVPLLTTDARLARAVADHADVPVLLAD